MSDLLKDRVVQALAAVLVLMTLAEWLIWPPDHPAFWWQEWAGYTVVIALAAALGVGYATKAWLAPAIQTAEDEDE